MELTETERTSKEPSGPSKRAKTATTKNAKRVIFKEDSGLNTFFKAMGWTQSVLDSSHIRVHNEINEKKYILQKSKH